MIHNENVKGHSLIETQANVIQGIQLLYIWKGRDFPYWLQILHQTSSVEFYILTLNFIEMAPSVSEFHITSHILC